MPIKNRDVQPPPHTSNIARQYMTADIKSAPVRRAKPDGEALRAVLEGKSPAKAKPKRRKAKRG